MFEHPVIDVALGLIFFYVTLSLVASAAQEWVASLVGLRSTNLEEGIKRLVGDKYAKAVYAHPLIKNLSRKDNQLPSYIAPETLSTVLLEVLAKNQDGKSFVSLKAKEVRELIAKLPQGAGRDVADKKDDDDLAAVLTALVTDGEKVAIELQEKLASWFDEGMTRISGWYKRKVKLFILIISGVVVIATNASTIHVAEALWTNEALRTQIAAQAEVAAKMEDVSALEPKNIDALKSFPIGWKEATFKANVCAFFTGTEWLKSIIGWLITVAAISLGAPFWFDLLGKVANLKGTGGKAQDKTKKAQDGTT
ncbi:hypothetical protein UF64_11135 [Thalassospira sp. HJ]|uniref:hypothetical protein n=1 Tax=Thalassospira sp. HJ TaxID=1616823 RepID=UPI0005CEA94F|nr:hypothetical protein [Thalassospira sp. HJ]KJE35203.1 hypothetical protein UF64_11135 [Thalassospira sp. HJ]